MAKSKFKNGDFVCFKSKSWWFARIIDIKETRFDSVEFVYQLDPDPGYWVAERKLQTCKSSKISVQNTGSFRMSVWRTPLADKKWVLNKARNCLLDISEDAACSIDARQFAAWEADVIRRRLPKLSQAHYKRK